MAVSDETAVGSGSAAPLRDALRPTAGLIRWLWLRLAVVILASLPALVAGLSGVGSGVARRPYYTEVEGKLPLVHLLRLFRDLPGSFVPAAIAGVVLAVLADQLLTGGALAFFDPARPASERGKVSTAVFKDGLAHFWAFLRIIGLSLVLWAVGIALLRLVFKRLDVMAYQSGWAGRTVLLRLPVLSTLLALLWMASVGAWTFWCRLLTVADRRVRVRRTGLLVLRVFWRHPLRSWGVFTAATLLATLVSGAVLVAWRQAEPRTGGGVLGWALLWLVTLLVQASVWLWLLRAGRLLYASDGLADLRGKPDEPFRVFARLLRWRKRAKKDTATTGSPGAAEPPARASGDQ